jgi:hypothetical protein
MKLSEIPQELVGLLRESGDFSDEMIEALSPKMIKLMSKVPELLQYDLVMECTESTGCTAGIRVGNKIVMDAFGKLNNEKTDCDVCVWALSHLPFYLSMIWDRFGEGLDPNEMWWNTVECVDTGTFHGGVGKTYYKLYVEKAT